MHLLILELRMSNEHVISQYLVLVSTYKHRLQRIRIIFWNLIDCGQTPLITISCIDRWRPWRWTEPISISANTEVRRLMRQTQMHIWMNHHYHHRRSEFMIIPVPCSKISRIRKRDIMNHACLKQLIHWSDRKSNIQKFIIISLHHNVQIEEPRRSVKSLL